MVAILSRGRWVNDQTITNVIWTSLRPGDIYVFVNIRNLSFYLYFCLLCLSSFKPKPMLQKMVVVSDELWLLYQIRPGKWIANILLHRLIANSFNSFFSKVVKQSNLFVWNIINWAPRNKLQWNFNKNSYIFIQEYPFQNVVWKMAAILSWPHWGLVTPYGVGDLGQHWPR